MSTPHMDSLRKTWSSLEKTCDKAIGLPSASYRDEDYFNLEKQAIFNKRWISIGFASDVPNPGDVWPVEILGKYLFVIRDGNKVRVFHNFCPHRGTLLVKGQGKDIKKFVCPYHSWSFDLKGNLINAPNNKDCIKTAFHLNEVRSAIWNDVIFINFAADAPDLDKFIEPLNHRWKDFDFSQLHPGGEMTYDFPANWKLITENFLECYHVPSVHPRLATYSKFRNRYPIYFDEEFLGQGSRVYKPEVTEFELPRWPGVSGKLEFQAEYVAIFPNTLVGRMPDHVFIWTVTPLSAQRTLERLKFYFIGDDATHSRFAKDREATLKRWKEVNDEDFEVVSLIHAGNRSEAFSGARFIPEHEKNIYFFQKLVLKEILDCVD
ncbi:aromatic ring-hydroxylating oxygenase subunit alpha [Lonsdalea quercina]|uniref:aromatic ring-hydroxylating oxygenase subunit alpha n=1 Tax=Lonsdalea quercina TaxID=71657 RepID=UPI003976914F